MLSFGTAKHGIAHEKHSAIRGRVSIRVRNSGSSESTFLAEWSSDRQARVMSGESPVSHLSAALDNMRVSAAKAGVSRRPACP
jgi:hypothetical protein